MSTPTQNQPKIGDIAVFSSQGKMHEEQITAIGKHKGVTFYFLSKGKGITYQNSIYTLYYADQDGVFTRTVPNSLDNLAFISLAEYKESEYDGRPANFQKIGDIVSFMVDDKFSKTRIISVVYNIKRNDQSSYVYHGTHNKSIIFGRGNPLLYNTDEHGRYISATPPTIKEISFERAG